jgi:bifunctional pyridoxal-dependent enzyme with beta-cystathionase and maltose regulon repressor activities
VDRGINTDEVAEPNTFAIQAAEAAFDEGEEWLEELREYLEQNRQFLIASLKELVPEIQVIEAEATYLAWYLKRDYSRNRSRATPGLCLLDFWKSGNQIEFEKQN